MVEGSFSLSPVLVFNSGPIFHPHCDLNHNSSSSKDKDTLNNFVWDNGRELRRPQERNACPHEEARETAHNGMCKWHNIDNTSDIVLPGQPLLTDTGSETLQLEDLHPKAKDDNDFYWIKRCLSAGSGEDIKTAHGGGGIKSIGRRMSDSLLHIHHVDRVRRNYASKTADERANKTKGSLLKNWISVPLQLFNKSANPKSDITEKDLVASPRIGRKLLMPMLNRPRSYFDILRGRRCSDPSFECKIDKNSQCDKLTNSAECLSSKEEKTDWHNEFDDVCLFKQEDIKIQSLLEKILRSHMLSMREYSVTRCDEASRNITKLVSSLLRAMKETEAEQVKSVCQVFIGAVEDDGIFTAVQSLWNQEWDNFASASFRNDAVFGLIVVFMIPY